MASYFLIGISVRNPLICSYLTKEWCTFANPNLKNHGRIYKESCGCFPCGASVCMRVDYSKQGYVLFNRNLNVLGNGEHARLEELPLEEFDVDEIPLEGEIIKEHAGFTDVFFYSDCTNPYAGYVLDLKKLKVYNQFIYPLAMVLSRKL